MPLTSAVVKNGATAMTPTGGTDQTFTPDGQTVANGIHIADAAQTDFRIRDNVTLKSKQPTLAADGTYSKSKRSATLVLPRTLPNGKPSFPLIRMEVEAHPDLAASVEQELRMKGAQMLTSSHFSAFWVTGSQA